MKFLKALLIVFTPTFCIAGQHVQQNDASLTIGSMTLLTGGAIKFPDGTVQITSAPTGSGTNLLPSTQTWSGQNNWTSPAQSTFTYGLVAGSITVNGPGNGVIQETINQATSTVTSSTQTWTVGHCLSVATTNYQIGDTGSACGSGGGGANPGGSKLQLQYQLNGTTFGGVANSIVTSTAVIVSSLSVLNNTTTTGNVNPGPLDVFLQGAVAGTEAMTVGCSSHANAFQVPCNTFVDMSALGSQSGSLVAGDTIGGSGLWGNRIYSAGDNNAFIDLRTNGTSSGTWQTTTGSGPGDIRLVPGGTLLYTLSTQTGETVLSTETVKSNPQLANAAIIIASGIATTGSYSNPDYFQAYSHGASLECYGFVTDADGSTNPAWSMCRNASSPEIDFGWKAINGGINVPLKVITNGNFPVGSTVTVTGGFLQSQGPSSLTGPIVLGQSASSTSIVGIVVMSSTVVMSSGITTINGVTYNWPSTHSANFLKDDGSGNLSWAATPGGGGSSFMVAVGTGGIAGYTGVITSSSTTSQVILFDSSTMTSQLIGGTTIFIGIGTISNKNLASGTYGNITGIGTQSQALNMGTHLINNVVDPASAQDAATKNYVDTNVNSLFWKQSARLATTVALPANTYSNGASGVGATLAEIGFGTLSIDGVVPSLSDRVLIKNEATQANNGIYSVTTVGSVGAAYLLTRTADYNQTGEVQAGDSLFITSGTTLANSGWIQVTSGTITIGSSPIVFNQFTGLGEVTAGYGLTESGNVISLITNSTSYIQNTSSLQSGSTSYPDFLYVGTSATIKAMGVSSLSASPAQIDGNHNLIAAPISLSTAVVGTLPDVNLTSNVGFLNGINTWSGQNNFTSPLPSTFTGIVTAQGFATYGTGTGFQEFNIGGSTYNATSSSSSYTVGQFAQYTSTNATLGGGTPTVTINTTNGLAGGGTNSTFTLSVSSVSLSTQVVGNLPTSNLNSGSGATSTTFWRGDGTWNTPTAQSAASTLAVGTGTTAGYTGTIVSSPTSIVLFDNAYFKGTLQGGSTAFVTPLSSTFTELGNAIGSNGNVFYNNNGIHGGGGNTFVTASSFTTVGPDAALGGLNISSGIVINATNIITATTTITSTMSVVEASCTTRGAAPTAWITLTLPLAANYSGQDMMIYDVGGDSCSVRVQGNGTDLIESTGTIQLNAQFQHASLHSLGSLGWGSGTGGIQYTPWSVFTTQDDVGTFSVAASSQVTMCPIYLPVPTAFMGVRLDRATFGGGSPNTTVAIFDRNNKFIVQVSSMTLVNSVSNYLAGGVTQLSPGYYKVAIVMSNTTTAISGSNSVGDVKMFCGTAGTSTTGIDLSTFVPSNPLTGAGATYPAIDLLFNGGLQGF